MCAILHVRNPMCAILCVQSYMCAILMPPLSGVGQTLQQTSRVDYLILYLLIETRAVESESRTHESESLKFQDSELESAVKNLIVEK